MMPTSDERLHDKDDDDDNDPDRVETITFLTGGTWTTHDLELLCGSVSRIYDSRLATLLWIKRFVDNTEHRRRMLKKALHGSAKHMPGPFFHEWYEGWIELLEKGEFPELAFAIPFPFVLQTDFPTAGQVFQFLDFYADATERCVIYSARMSSPGGFSFTGLGEIVREFRELVKDIWYRNSQEKRKGEIEIGRSELDLVEKYLALKDRQVSSHELNITVANGIEGLIKLEHNGKLRPVNEHIDDQGDL